MCIILAIFPDHVSCTDSLLGLQFRLRDKLVRNRVLSSQNGTAVLNSSKRVNMRSGHDEVNSFEREQGRDDQSILDNDDSIRSYKELRAPLPEIAPEGDHCYALLHRLCAEVQYVAHAGGRQ